MIENTTASCQAEWSDLCHLEPSEDKNLKKFPYMEAQI